MIGIPGGPCLGEYKVCYTLQKFYIPTPTSVRIEIAKSWDCSNRQTIYI